MFAFAAFLFACTKSPSDADSDPSDTDDTDVPIPCTLAFVGDPVLRGDDPLLPLSRAMTVSVNSAAELEITATDADGEAVDWRAPAATDHDLPLVGLHADGEWTLTVRAVAEDGCAADAAPVAFATGTLPSPLPYTDVLSADLAAMQPGYTIVPIYTKDISYITLVDDSGRIVWIYGPTPEKFTEIRLLPSGNLLALNDVDIIEFDWMGPVRIWSSESSPTKGGIPIALPGFHHDVLWTSRDTIVVLSKGTRFIENFPASESDVSQIADADVGQDLIVELDPATGAILHTLDVTTMLDLKRLGYDSLTNGQEGYEWSHNNAVDEDVVNGRWILSARNQDAVFAVDQAYGSVDWILANHDNWHSEFTDLLLDPPSDGSPFEWAFHQHAAKYDPTGGRVLLFDNGNARASPWTGETPTPASDSYSRVVEFAVDEVAGTVVQNWEFRLDPDLFSFAMGDADWLPNGNVLADFAYVEWQGGQEMESFGRGNNTVRVVELEPVSGQVIWELDIWGALADDPNAWQAYRTQRIPRPYGP